MNLMTPKERKQLHEKLNKEMKNKIYLYDVFVEIIGGSRIIAGSICADNDDEAIKYALLCFPGSIAIQRDHWGRGPIIEIKQTRKGN